MKATLLRILPILLFSMWGYAADPICSRESQGAALVIIDMQPFFAERSGAPKTPANTKKLQDTIKTQIEAIKSAKKANTPIIFLEYEHAIITKGGETNSELKAAVRDYKLAKFFKKTTDGMFESYNKYRADLVDYVQKNHIGKLIITGANGGACVYQSISGSLEGNCTVYAYSAGIIDLNYQDFIYPYAGKYTNFKPTCKDCQFKEISNIDQVNAELSTSDHGGRSASSNSRVEH